MSQLEQRRNGQSMVDTWRKVHPRRMRTIPTTIRLLPAVDCQIQEILADFDHLTMAKVVNDLLTDALDRLKYEQKRPS